MTETDVMVPTPDGKADAALFHPAGAGPWPAVLMWPDILGLRPVFREMGRRLAADGYTVLVPNPFYRTKRAPIVTGPFDFNDPKQVEPLMSLKATLTDAGIDKDAAAYITFLDQQKQTDKRKGAGVQGYCFSGPFAFHTGAVRADRIRAVATFHGGGLVTKDANSPHLLIPKTKASFRCRDRAQRRPEAARSQGRAEIDVRRSQAPGDWSRFTRPTTAGACPAALLTTNPLPNAPGPSCSSCTGRPWSDGYAGCGCAGLDLGDQLAVDLLGALVGGAVGHPPRIIDERRPRLEQVERQA